MTRTLSEFHYTTLFINGNAFAEAKRFHDEMAFKLGLPSRYDRNFDSFLDFLSTIGDSRSNLCAHWEWRTGKRLVLRVFGFSAVNVDDDVVSAFTQAVADANNRLEQNGATNRIWVEYTSADMKD